MPADIAELITSYLPSGWRFSHVILLDTDWQVIIADDEHCVSATGGSIEEALCNATLKADAGEYTGRLFDGTLGLSVRTVDLSALVQEKKAEPILRRL